MCEGLSTLIGPIPADPVFTNNANSRNLSARSDYSLCEGPSKISGPIVSHYGSDGNKVLVDFSRNPRVRGDGLSNFISNKRANGFSFMITNQERPLTQNSFKTRQRPKNYIASNTYKIKEIMRKAKEREIQKEKSLSDKNAPVKALYRSAKFEHVESKIKNLMINEQKARPQTARETTSAAEGESMKLSLENRSKDDIDFIKRNQKLATQVKIKKRAPSVEQLKSLQEKTNADFEAYLNRNKGKVPNYIQKRKEGIQKAQIEFENNLPDPEQPAGHRKLPESERIATLNLLQETQKKMISEVNSLPIRDDTLRLRQTKSDYEKRLAEVDEAIKIFSKAKVFVKINE